MRKKLTCMLVVLAIHLLFNPLSAAAFCANCCKSDGNGNNSRRNEQTPPAQVAGPPAEPDLPVNPAVPNAAIPAPRRSRKSRRSRRQIVPAREQRMEAVTMAQAQPAVKRIPTRTDRRRRAANGSDSVSNCDSSDLYVSSSRSDNHDASTSTDTGTGSRAVSTIYESQISLSESNTRPRLSTTTCTTESSGKTGNSSRWRSSGSSSSTIEGYLLTADNEPVEHEGAKSFDGDDLIRRIRLLSSMRDEDNFSDHIESFKCIINGPNGIISRSEFQSTSSVKHIEEVIAFIISELDNCCVDTATRLYNKSLLSTIISILRKFSATHREQIMSTMCTKALIALCKCMRPEKDKVGIKSSMLNALMKHEKSAVKDFYDQAETYAPSRATTIQELMDVRLCRAISFLLANGADPNCIEKSNSNQQRIHPIGWLIQNATECLMQLLENERAACRDVCIGDTNAVHFKRIFPFISAVLESFVYSINFNKEIVTQLISIKSTSDDVQHMILYRIMRNYTLAYINSLLGEPLNYNQCDPSTEIQTAPPPLATTTTVSATTATRRTTKQDYNKQGHKAHTSPPRATTTTVPGEQHSPSKPRVWFPPGDTDIEVTTMSHHHPVKNEIEEALLHHTWDNIKDYFAEQFVALNTQLPSGHTPLTFVPCNVEDPKALLALVRNLIEACPDDDTKCIVVNTECAETSKPPLFYVLSRFKAAIDAALNHSGHKVIVDKQFALIPALCEARTLLLEAGAVPSGGTLFHYLVETACRLKNNPERAGEVACEDPHILYTITKLILNAVPADLDICALTDENGKTVEQLAIELNVEFLLKLFRMNRHHSSDT